MIRDSIESDKFLIRLNSNLEMARDPALIMMATDTYNGLLHAGYDKEESLKLTQIICDNYFKKAEMRREEEKLQYEIEG